MLDRLLNRSNTLEKALDATWLRNEVISQNIANVDTPNYKRKSVQFEELLSNAMEERGVKGVATDKRHIPIGQNEVSKLPIKVSVDNSSLSMRLDGNNVDIENEMAAMAKNTIQYNTLTQKLNSEFRLVKSVISEGRK